MAVYSFSVQAKGRLVEIYEYSLINFGERQADAYYMSLHDTFELLAGAPLMGRQFHEFRRHEHDPYVIFYELADDGVVISAIYHHSENIGAKLNISDMRQKPSF